MSNILRAFINIVKNRANNRGEGLETYIKDVFANTLNEEDTQKKLETLSNVFSYQGNKNNPPERKRAT